MCKGHILLISPSTFSYHLSIIKTLNLLGYEVIWWDDRAYKNIFYKVALRLIPKATKKYFDRPFRDKLSKLNSKKITHVLVVKGEGLSSKFGLEMRKRLFNASFGLYLWDSVRNNKGVINILNIFDSVSTFDPYDSEVYKWTYRPLFNRNLLEDKKTKIYQNKFDWAFIGTIHSDRYRIINKLRNSTGQNRTSFVFCYFQNPIILFFRKIIDYRLWLAPQGSISTKPMSADEVNYYIKNSTAILDIEHPNQTGLTMRTIETLLSEKKLITTNKSIVSSNLYDVSRVYVISRKNPHIPNDFFNYTFLPISDSLKYYYSCEGWVVDVLNSQDSVRYEKKSY
jgi:hypothetical protein